MYVQTIMIYMSVLRIAFRIRQQNAIYKRIARKGPCMISEDCNKFGGNKYIDN
jgi:hypothetical protein